QSPQAGAPSAQSRCAVVRVGVFMSARLDPSPQVAAESSITRLIAERRPGHMLPAGFYLRDDVCAADRDVLFLREWLLVATSADVPEPGDTYTVEIASASVIIVRD